jgi:hypothetical protein
VARDHRLIAMVVSRLLPCLALCACGVAIGTGAKPARAPEKFEDADTARAHETQKQDMLLKESVVGPKPAPPPVGVSLVIGGTPVDAGPLPKPPIPIVKPDESR